MTDKRTSRKASQRTDAAAKSKKSRARKGSGFGITAVFTLLLAAYMVFLTSRFIFTKKIRYCIAETGRLESSFSEPAVLVREEILVSASEKGVVRYDYPGGQRLKKNTQLGVMLDASRNEDLLNRKMAEVYEELEEQDAGQSAYFQDVEEEMLREVAGFLSEKTASCDSLYRLKDALARQRTYRMEIYTLSANKRVLALLEEAGVYLEEMSEVSRDLYLKSAGILEYSYDGYEGWTVDQFDESFVRKYSVSGANSSYRYMDVSLKEREKGDPLYRIITSEKWRMVLFVPEKEAGFFAGEDVNTVSFLYNGTEPMTASVKEARKIGERWKVVLELDSRMQAHDGERVATLTFTTGVVSGVKISDQCLTDEDFYVLPKEYVSRSGASDSVLKWDGEKAVAVRIDVLWTDGEQCFFRLPDALKPGDRVFSFMGEGQLGSGAAPDPARLRELRDRKVLTGVYVVNGNNEVFRAVTVEYRGDGYAIVSGISRYDRVKLMN